MCPYLNVSSELCRATVGNVRYLHFLCLCVVNICLPVCVCECVCFYHYFTSDFDIVNRTPFAVVKFCFEPFNRSNKDINFRPIEFIWRFYYGQKFKSQIFFVCLWIVWCWNWRDLMASIFFFCFVLFFGKRKKFQYCIFHRKCAMEPNTHKNRCDLKYWNAPGVSAWMKTYTPWCTSSFQTSVLRFEISIIAHNTKYNTHSHSTVFLCFFFSFGLSLVNRRPFSVHIFVFNAKCKQTQIIFNSITTKQSIHILKFTIYLWLPK